MWYWELLLLLLLLKVGVKGWGSESLELLSLSDEKDGECSCGVVAVDLGGKWIFFLFQSKYRVRLYMELYIG